MEVARYGKEFKDKAVARLLPPESSAIELVSREIGISVGTLERWRAQALAQQQRMWTAAARFEAVLATAAMDEESKSAWCRKHGKRGACTLLARVAEVRYRRRGVAAGTAPASPGRPRFPPSLLRITVAANEGHGSCEWRQ